MEHKEYKYINKDANTAVLFIHGIVGTPNHFREFVRLIPSSCSVLNLLLDGHGQDAKAFSKTSMKRWEAQVEAAVEELAAGHDNVYVVAHSMGTLLAIEQAIRNPKITQLFLLAVPLKLSLKPRMFRNSFNVHFNRIRPDDREAVAAKRCYGIENDRNPFHYLGWIPRLLELLAKMRQTRNQIEKLTTPCAVYPSRNDEMVSRKSVRWLAQNPSVSIKELADSSHFCYGEKDFEFVLNEFTTMIRTERR